MPKISQLTADASPSSDDLIVTVNDPSGTPGSRKVTVGNLAASDAFSGTYLALAGGALTGDLEFADDVGTDDLVLVRREGGAAHRLALTGKAGSDTNPFFEVNPVPGASTGDPTIAGMQVYRVGDGSLADREFLHIEARGSGYEDYVIGSFASGTGEDRPIRFTMGGVEAFHIAADGTIQLSKQLYGLTALYLDGTAGNYVNLPVHGDLTITGDIDLRVKLAPNDWTPTADMALISRYLPTGDQRSYLFLLETTGYLRLLWTTDGTSGTLKNVASTVAPPGVVNGEVTWLRATLDVDNGATGHDVKFWGSDDGETWTQIGATVTTAGTTSIHAGTADLRVGARNDDGVPFAGKVHRASVRNGIGGSLTCQLICDAGAVDPRYRDNTGKIWTFTGSAWSWMTFSG